MADRAGERSGRASLWLAVAGMLGLAAYLALTAAGQADLALYGVPVMIGVAAIELAALVAGIARFSTPAGRSGVVLSVAVLALLAILTGGVTLGGPSG